MNTYVVFVGRRPGLYSDWAECNNNVSGYTGSVYCAFDTREEAQAAYENYCREKHMCENSLKHSCSRCKGSVKLCVDNNKKKGTIGRHYYKCLDESCAHFQWASHSSRTNLNEGGVANDASSSSVDTLVSSCASSLRSDLLTARDKIENALAKVDELMPDFENLKLDDKFVDKAAI